LPELEVPVELEQLNDVRLERDWTFRQLAEDMASRDLSIPARTLHLLLTNPPDKPYDRTLFKIRRYLDSLSAQRSPNRPRKSKGRAAA